MLTILKNLHLVNPCLPFLLDCLPLHGAGEYDWTVFLELLSEPRTSESNHTFLNTRILYFFDQMPWLLPYSSKFSCHNIFVNFMIDLEITKILFTKFKN